MAGDFLHGGQHSFVDETAATELFLDHAMAEVGEVGFTDGSAPTISTGAAGPVPGNEPFCKPTP